MTLREHGDRIAGKVGRVWSGRTVPRLARLARWHGCTSDNGTSGMAGMVGAVAAVAV
jgi:hypothetical protein